MRILISCFTITTITIIYSPIPELQPTIAQVHHLRLVTFSITHLQITILGICCKAKNQGKGAVEVEVRCATAEGRPTAARGGCCYGCRSQFWVQSGLPVGETRLQSENRDRRVRE